MKSVHLVIPDLFLPKDIAAGVCADLRLPALEKMLGRGASTGSDPSTGSGRTGEGGCLENHLCELFGVPCQADAPVAPVSAAFDGLAAGCWLRADPVHWSLQRDQLLLLPNAEVSADEAGQMCAGLNEHFAGQGMEFFAHRCAGMCDWMRYRASAPPLSQVLGRNSRLANRGRRGTGIKCSTRYRCCCSHPVNEAREHAAIDMAAFGCGVREGRQA